MSKHEHDQHDDPLVSISDDVRQLVEGARHAERFEPYDEQRRRHLPSRLHWTRHPSLLDQLRAAETAGQGSSDGPMTGGYESRPTARLEALDRLHAIDQAVDDWLVRKLHTYGQRTTLEENLRALVGAAGDLDALGRTALAREVCRWLTWARVVTGWESAPWRPNAACPMCEQRGGLRVRLEDHAAACLDCGETWDHGTLGLLADHLRDLNAESEAGRKATARLGAELTTWFPYRGPCLCASCGRSGQDARHRLIDDVVAQVAAGLDPAFVAFGHAMPEQAVLVAVAWSRLPERLVEQIEQSA